MNDVDDDAVASCAWLARPVDELSCRAWNSRRVDLSVEISLVMLCLAVCAAVERLVDLMSVVLASGNSSSCSIVGLAVLL